MTPEYVIAFIPGDPLLAAALEHDPSTSRVTRSSTGSSSRPRRSLIALLRTIAFGWQQESLAENALEVQKAGRELYRRLSTFGDHLAKAGRSLGGAVDAYNKAVGSLERNVLPQARRFNDLGVGVSDQPMPEPEPIDAMPRLLQAPELGSRRRTGTRDEVVELDIRRSAPRRRGARSRRSGSGADAPVSSHGSYGSGASRRGLHTGRGARAHDRDAVLQPRGPPRAKRERRRGRPRAHETRLRGHRRIGRVDRRQRGEPRDASEHGRVRRIELAKHKGKGEALRVGLTEGRGRLPGLHRRGR